MKTSQNKIESFFFSCPECDTPLSFSQNKKVGKIIECPACGTENELISLNPVKVVPLEEEK